ncbi:MAG TPA: hypothetical protein VFU14_07320 [Acidimicrobiales bacterium]|nr:hypothetical protein [Acidimicrobiales bacterium]
MKKKLAALAVAGASLGLFAVGAPSAGAAHCVEGDSPGFSYFGTEHVQGDAHDNEGQGRHMGTSGASNCRETTGSPAERAPGQDR